MSTQGNAQTPPQHTVDGKDAVDKDSDVAGPSGVKFALLMVSAFAAMFLVSLVREISQTTKQTRRQAPATISAEANGQRLG